jgi:hypothetical protein
MLYAKRIRVQTSFFARLNKGRHNEEKFTIGMSGVGRGNNPVVQLARSIQTFKFAFDQWPARAQDWNGTVVNNLQFAVH